MSYPNLTERKAYCLAGLILYYCVVGLLLIVIYSLNYPSPLPDELCILGLVPLVPLVDGVKAFEDFFFMIGLGLVSFICALVGQTRPAAGGDEALLVKLLPNQIFKSGQSQVLLQLLCKTKPDTQSSSSPPPTPGFQ